MMTPAPPANTETPCTAAPTAERSYRWQPPGSGPKALFSEEAVKEFL